MKILYLASKLSEAGSLMLEQEITDLQRRFSSASGEPVLVTFLPNIKFEELGLEISRYAPDILHLSAHGDEEGLTFINETRTSVEVTGGMLRTLLDIDRPPRLVYINACNSGALAQELSALIPMVIGTTAPITNGAARASAVLFYDRLLQGRPVQHAFEAGGVVIDGLQNKLVRAELYCQPGTDPKLQRIHAVPQIIASLVGDSVKRTHGGYDFNIGLIGHPQNTNSVLFFTNHRGFLDEDHPEKSLVSVVLDPSGEGEIWADEEWWTDTEFRLWACGTTRSSQFVVSSTICEAVEQWYKTSLYNSTLTTMPSSVRQALNHLRAAVSSKPKTKRPKATKGRGRSKKKLD